MEVDLVELADVAMIELLHDADFADQGLGWGFRLPDDLGRVDDLDGKQLPGEPVNSPQDRRERPLSELAAYVVLRIEALGGRPACRVAIDKACGCRTERFGQTKRQRQRQRRRTIVLCAVGGLWDACPERDLVPVLEHPGAASSDLFAIDLL